MFKFLERVKATRIGRKAITLRDTAQVQAYIPTTTLSNDATEALPRSTQIALQETLDHLHSKDFDAAAARIDRSYAQARQISPGYLAPRESRFASQC